MTLYLCSPFLLLNLPSHPSHSSTTWPFVQGCVTELSVPRKPCPPPLNALKPSPGHSSSASPAAHKAPRGQIWAHFRHWTGWIKPGFGPKFISRNFIEISTNSSDSMLPWKKGGSFFSSSCNILPGKHLRVHQQCQKNPVI